MDVQLGGGHVDIRDMKNTKVGAYQKEGGGDACIRGLASTPRGAFRACFQKRARPHGRIRRASLGRRSTDTRGLFGGPFLTVLPSPSLPAPLWWLRVT